MFLCYHFAVFNSTKILIECSIFGEGFQICTAIDQRKVDNDQSIDKDAVTWNGKFKTLPKNAVLYWFSRYHAEECLFAKHGLTRNMRLFRVVYLFRTLNFLSSKNRKKEKIMYHRAMNAIEIRKS